MPATINYMKELQEAQRRQREKEAAEKQRARQAIERGTAPASDTEIIVKHGMEGKPPPTQPIVSQAEVQKVQEAAAQGAWSPWSQQPLNLPRELDSYTKGNQVDVVGFLRDASNDTQAAQILGRAGFSQTDINDAKQRVEYENVLAPYRSQASGNYNLHSAVMDAVSAKTNKEELEIVDAVKGLFSKSVYNKFEKLLNQTRQGSKLWVDEGPWTRAYQDVQQSAPWIFGALSTTKGTPIPHDDIVVYLLLGAAVGTAAIGSAIKGKKGGTDNMALVEFTGESLKSVAFIKPETLRSHQIEILVPPRAVTRQLEGIPQHRLTDRGKEKVQPPIIKVDWEKITGQKNPTVIWIDPKWSQKDIGVTGIVQAQVETKVAEKQVIDIGIKIAETGKYLPATVKDSVKSLQTAETTESMRRHLDIINNWAKHQDGYKAFREAYNDWRMRIQELNDAKRVYVETINPQPIKGKLSKEDIEAIAAAKLLQLIDKDVKANTKPKLAQVLQYAESPLLNNAVKVYEDTLSKTDSETKAEEATKTYVQQQIDTLTEPAVKTKTAVRTASKALTQALTNVAAATATASHATATSKTRPFKLPKGGDGGDDKNRRRIIKASLGAVTYRRGKLNNKDVWHVFYVDKGGNPNRTIVLGPAPQGATVSIGKGSASATLKRIRGKKVPNFRHVEDTGASDTIITSSGGKLTITFTGNIVGDGKGRISDGMPRISGGRGRITPKMPRLR